MTAVRPTHTSLGWAWLFASSLLASQPAGANEAEPWVRVECTLRSGVAEIDRCGVNDNCIFVVSRPRNANRTPFEIEHKRDTDAHRFSLSAPKPGTRESEYGKLDFHGYDDQGLAQEAEHFLDAVAQYCEEDSADLRKSFRNAVTQWRGEGAGKVGRRTRSEILHFEPWTEEIERTGMRVVGQDETCKYGQRERHGAWLAVTERTCFHKPVENDVVVDSDDGSTMWRSVLLFGAAFFVAGAVVVVVRRLRRRNS